MHDLTALVRGTVRFAADPSAPDVAGISEDGSAILRELARTTPYSTLLRVLTLLSEAEGTLRRPNVDRQLARRLAMVIHQVIDRAVQAHCMEPRDFLRRSAEAGASEEMSRLRVVPLIGRNWL